MITVESSATRCRGEGSLIEKILHLSADGHDRHFIESLQKLIEDSWKVAALEADNRQLSKNNSRLEMERLCFSRELMQLQENFGVAVGEARNEEAERSQKTIRSLRRELGKMREMLEIAFKDHFQLCARSVQVDELIAAAAKAERVRCKKIAADYVACVCCSHVSKMARDIVTKIEAGG